MHGKYLAEARSAAQEARDRGESSDILRSLDALIEAFTELEARVTSVEIGPPPPEQQGNLTGQISPSTG
jgi:hypothetical protein